MGINDLEACRAAVEDLLAQGVRRFICMDEDLCLRTATVLREKNLSIPGDAELASMADSEQLHRISPAIGALYFDAGELGRIACRELLNALNDAPFDPKPRLGYTVRMEGRGK